MNNRFYVLFGVLLIVSMFVCVVALEDPSVGTGGEDVEQIKGLIGNYSPLDESGDVNFSKYQPFKSKAEERIEKINLWLKDNASWLKIVFGMVPEISWLFAINIYILLFFLVSIVFNGKSMWGFLEVLNKKIDLVFFETSWASIFGLGVFIVLLVTKFFTNVLARPAYAFWALVYEYVFSTWGIVIAIIILVVIAVVFILLLVYAPGVLIILKKKMDARKEAKAKEAAEFDKKILHETVKGITGQD